MIVIDKSLGEINPEGYLIKNAKDNTYLLALPNNLNGYNYFEVYIDKLNRSIHVFDSLENRKGGTSAINSVDRILKIRRPLNLDLDYKLVIYYPDHSIFKACITTYHERKGFNKNRDYVTYIPFLKKAELFLKNRF
ncbi:hypothetical protein ACHM2J_10760 [Clostridium perfringens]|mgnify:FL=1|uniref:Uncharacterized protein n=2 Tax=Clostridium perfringens TaxID=1502 RepID=B6F183_CLOPF|nr:hypothetical protein [Clostridium perfringens]EDT22204.1 conserved hypothetical protein [Clostridium perfringens B str. ATCC 3626]EDT22996.1 conserved hypothetical protein [Clostridium perfringens B str. ATCC 3626]EHA1006768.1 hypothetical protein [Clostridium perfringens]EHA1009687.1 hypothetical protein [Clostridium perfringens]EHA1021754.1 hypothetical protein [Clostridium perfringens]